MNMKNLKLISTILLSMMLIFTISTAVFANETENEDIWSDVNVESENIGTEDENLSLFENEEENDFVEIPPVEENEEEPEEPEENEYENLYETRNDTTTDSDNLAHTGIGDSDGIMALIIVLSAIVAIYSAKKFNDYKNV